MKTRYKVAIGIGALYLAYKYGQRNQNMGFAIPFSEESKLLDMADQQVDAAESGQPLKDYRSAQNIQYFWKAPVGGQEAHAKSAYWLAVASRILLDKKLASLAREHMRKAAAYAAMPGSSLLEGDAAPVLTGAIAQLKPYEGEKSGNIKAIVAALGHQMIEGVAVQSQAKRDQQVYRNTLDASLEDAAKLVTVTRGAITGERLPGVSGQTWDTTKLVLDYGKGVFTGDPPPNVDPWKFATIKWGGRLVLVAGVLMLVRYAAKPYLEGAKAAWGKAKSGVSEVGALVQNGSRALQKMLETQ